MVVAKPTVLKHRRSGPDLGGRPPTNRGSPTKPLNF